MRTHLKLKKNSVKSTPLKNKSFFIGLSLGESPTTETGLAVLNKNLDILRIDKLYTNPEIEAFFKSFTGLTDSIVCISLAKSSLQLSSKWRQDEKNIHAFKLYESAEEMHWADRFSDRGNKLYEYLNSVGISTFRYNIHLAKMRLNLIPPFKKRSQPGCKYLQTVISDYLSVNNLPGNLIAISALDAVIGAYTGWKMATDKEKNGYEYIKSFNEQKVVIPIKNNPRPIIYE